MPVDPIQKYLFDLELAFNKLESGYIEKYEEEILTPGRISIRIRVRFLKGCLLEWNESVIAEGRHINHLGYRYHFQDKDNKLIFRYDNTPHFQEFETFPHHKHLSNKVIPVTMPTYLEVLKEVRGIVHRSESSMPPVAL